VDAEDIRPVEPSERHILESRGHVVVDSSRTRAVKLNDLRLEAIGRGHLGKLVVAECD
jgi:hypothetical protein